mmetsp:Transcript_75800/g.181266  ORF Transcript_75800/g.181266 Transcript_75800/m.181266 type:complete len:278 (-) Transcript_75800:864-1697(-)
MNSIGLLPALVGRELGAGEATQRDVQRPSEVVHSRHAAILNQAPPIEVRAEVHLSVPACVAPRSVRLDAVAQDIAAACAGMVLDQDRSASIDLPLRDVLVGYPLRPLALTHHVLDPDPVGSNGLVAEMLEVANEPRMFVHQGLRQDAGAPLDNEAGLEAGKHLLAVSAGSTLHRHLVKAFGQGHLRCQLLAGSIGTAEDLSAVQLHQSRRRTFHGPIEPDSQRRCVVAGLQHRPVLGHHLQHHRGYRAYRPRHQRHHLQGRQLKRHEAAALDRHLEG